MQLIQGNTYLYRANGHIMEVEYITPFLSPDVTGWYDFLVKSSTQVKRQNMLGVCFEKEDIDIEIITLSGAAVEQLTMCQSPDVSMCQLKKEEKLPEVVIVDSEQLKVESEISPAEIFRGKNVVVSGVYERYPVRRELKDLLKKYGADVKQGVTGTTNILVVGDKFGPKKMEKALELIEEGYNIQIIEEYQLYRILGTQQADMAPPAEKKPGVKVKKSGKKEMLIPLTDGRMWCPRPR
ncbi:MAG: BRCT domain-containing protein [Prevotella sp.]|jgi:hypothetical protein|nr:BRCT domain-containing protein [Prevotella sp.]